MLPPLWLTLHPNVLLSPSALVPPSLPLPPSTLLPPGVNRTSMLECAYTSMLEYACTSMLECTCTSMLEERLQGSISILGQNDSRGVLLPWDRTTPGSHSVLG